MAEGLAWPPRKEDLERLYLTDRLSAMKIAIAYGPHYKNAKVAESTILYHLKKNGIKRRDSAEHVRKVSSAMVDGWVARYRAGESLKQIAGSDVSSVTVWNQLRARGLPRRDKVEAQIRAVTKYERSPFEGDDIERAYLIGLRYGDLHALEHGRAVRVRLSTTHPAMADLFESLFSSYGHVMRYPRKAKLAGYEWTLECDLDQSFTFLLNKASINELELYPDSEFLAFLAGLFDAEGSIVIHRKGRWYNPEVYISNGDRMLLEAIGARLTALGFHITLTWREQQSDRGGISGESTVGRVQVSRFREANGWLACYRFVMLRKSREER